MRTALPLPLILLLACSTGGKDGGEGFFVEATIGGSSYSGASSGAVLDATPSLALFPADPLQGVLLPWNAGDTGDYALEFEQDAGTGNWLQYVDQSNATWVSQSGTLTIDSWEEHQPANDYDPVIGTISGSFESSLRCYMGGCDPGADPVEITGGSFRVQVEDSTAIGGDTGR